MVIMPDLQSYQSVRGFQYAIAFRGEHFADQLNHLGFVLDDQDGFFAVIRRRRDDSLGRAIHPRFCRQENTKGRAMAHFAEDLDPPLVLFYDAIHRR